MKVLCERNGEYVNKAASGIFLEGGTLTIFFNEGREKMIFVRPKLVYMSTQTAVVTAEEEIISGMGSLPAVWRFRIDWL